MQRLYYYPLLHEELIRMMKEANETDRVILYTKARLHQYFSKDWVTRNIEPTGKNKRSFFHIKLDNSNWNDVFSRIQILIEYIHKLSFRGIPGFSEQMNAFTSDPSEGRFTELSLAAQMARAEVTFGFHPRPVPHVDGDSYDFDVTARNGAVLAVEAKRRIDGTLFDAQKFARNLDVDAGKQLPKDWPGAMFVQVPPDWVCGPPSIAWAPVIPVAPEVSASLERFFMNNKRVVGALLYSHVPYRTTDTEERIGIRYSQNVSNHHCYDKAQDWRIFDPLDVLLGITVNAPWQTLNSLVEYVVNDGQEKETERRRTANAA